MKEFLNFEELPIEIQETFWKIVPKFESWILEQTENDVDDMAIKERLEHIEFDEKCVSKEILEKEGVYNITFDFTIVGKKYHYFFVGIVEIDKNGNVKMKSIDLFKKIKRISSKKYYTIYDISLEGEEGLGLDEETLKETLKNKYKDISDENVEELVNIINTFLIELQNRIEEIGDWVLEDGIFSLQVNNWVIEQIKEDDKIKIKDWIFKGYDEGSVMGWINFKYIGKNNQIIDIKTKIKNMILEGKTDEEIIQEFENYKTDEEIEKEFRDYKIEELKFFTKNSGFIEIFFPYTEESVGGGTIEKGGKLVEDRFIIHDNNKVAFEYWYPEKVYNEIKEYILKERKKQFE